MSILLIMFARDLMLILLRRPGDLSCSRTTLSGCEAQRCCYTFNQRRQENAADISFRQRWIRVVEGHTKERKDEMAGRVTEPIAEVARCRKRLVGLLSRIFRLLNGTSAPEVSGKFERLHKTTLTHSGLRGRG